MVNPALIHMLTIVRTILRSSVVMSVNGHTDADGQHDKNPNRSNEYHCHFGRGVSAETKDGESVQCDGLVEVSLLYRTRVLTNSQQT